MSQLTELLGRVQAGDIEARDSLFGGDRAPLTLPTEISPELEAGEETILKVHEALEVLEKADPRLALVAQMRYFGGYSEEEIAEALDVTTRTVQRDWEKGRLILAAALR